jgi:hypothetical protein
VRGLLKPLVVALLRRDEAEVSRRAATFHIRQAEGRELVDRLGRAFLGGFNAMLRLDNLERVADLGRRVDPHFRPFFFEGAAMGYLPRGYHASDCRAERAEAALLAMDPAYRYLYYVGLGFWFGFRSPRFPERIEMLSPYLDPMYAPLCYDGFGFKVGFFDSSGDVERTRVLERCPERHRRFAYQGLGRAMFFVFMDDEPGFHAFREALPEHSVDLEFGRSLARGFAGVDRADSLLAYTEGASDERHRTARLVGVAWALAARKMNDRDYFARCVARADATERSVLARLPEVCDRELARATSYADWQSRTANALVAIDTERPRTTPR